MIPHLHSAAPDRFRRLFASAVLVALFCSGLLIETPEAQASAWPQVPVILQRIVPPTFPAADFIITNYGAVGDGVTDCTQAFQDAITACNGAGGGRVVVPAGTFLTGAIHLQSNVNLNVAQGGTIRFSTNTQAYLPVVFTRFECTELMNYSPFIYAYQQTNIAITGAGTIDGRASFGPWYQWKTTGVADDNALLAMGSNDVPVAQRIFGAGHFLRPAFVQPVACQNVLIEGVRFTNSPMWMLTPLYCTNVTIRGVTVESLSTSPNTDGCDPDSSTDVLIQNCSFSDGDDCIAIKSGRDRDGRRVNVPSQNIVIQNCTFKNGHGGVTVGSETSGGITNVFAENCNFSSSSLDMAIRLKTGPSRGGFIQGVNIRNCIIKTANIGVHMTMRYSGTVDGTTNTMPVVGNIDIRDSAFNALAQQSIFIQGYSSDFMITNVTLANCKFPNNQTTNSVTSATQINLLNNRGGGL